MTIGKVGETEGRDLQEVLTGEVKEEAIMRKPTRASALQALAASLAFTSISTEDRKTQDGRT